MLQSAVTAKQKWMNKNCRQIAVVGEEGLEKLQRLSVLVIGLKGTGVEIAKNLILMGITKITICDKGTVQWSDLSSNFFLGPTDIGRNRAEAVLQKLRELNEECEVEIFAGDLSEDLIARHGVVVLSDSRSKADSIKLNEWCRKNSTPGNTICCVICESMGVLGSIFVDFGEKFTSLDPDGEPLRQGFVHSISREKKAIVHLDKEMHQLGHADKVVLTECSGDFAALNGKEFAAEGKSPNTFQIDCDTTSFQKFEGAGWWKQIKAPAVFEMQPLSEFYGKPLQFGQFQPQDDFFNRQPLCFLVLEALQNFYNVKGRLPQPYNLAECEVVFQEVLSQNETYGDDKIDFDEAFVRNLILPSSGDLCPIATILGGLAANQCITAITGLWSPINQWFFIEATRALPKQQLKETDIKLNGTRYDGQIAVYGNAFVQKLGNLKYFQVGAGAIGCELLKNFSLMGLACGPTGKLTVTDMDTIEVSNLTRQFLFRAQHVGKHKAEVAADVAKSQNPDIKIVSMKTKVARDTENVFDNEFWFGLSGIANALDNFEARRYVNSRCLFFKKPLVDSGTSGTQCESSTVQPALTLGWGADAADPTQETFEECTLHSLPNKIQHTISYAHKVTFHRFFVSEPTDVQKFLSTPDYLKSLLGVRRVQVLQALKNSFCQRPKNWEDCIEWAVRTFEVEFNFKARDLLTAFPLDKVDEDGTPYWSGIQRPPTPINLDVHHNQLHLDFIVALTHLRAFTMGITPSEFKPDTDEEFQKRIAHIRDFASKLIPAGYEPNVKTNPDGSLSVGDRSLPSIEEQNKLEALLADPELKKVDGWKPIPVDFEKDNDDNFHIDCITAWSNLRATMYSIKPETRFRTKHIVGNIVPAIITATAFITGLVCLELIKQHQPGKVLDDFCANVANLAGPTLQRFPPPKNETLAQGKIQYSTWTRIDLPQKEWTGKPTEYTVRDFEAYLLKLQIKIETIGAGTAVLWMGDRTSPDYHQPLLSLYREVILKNAEFPSNLQHVVLNISASLKDGTKLDLTEKPLPPFALWLVPPPQKPVAKKKP